MKAETAWAVVNPEGEILSWTADESENAAMFRYETEIAVSWEYAENQGYRCVRVEILEIQEGEEC